MATGSAGHRVNRDFEGVRIEGEEHSLYNGDIIGLSHDTFITTDFSVRTGDWETLEEGVHYAFRSEDESLSARAGKTVYTEVEILDTPSNSLFFDYYTVGDYVDAADMNMLINEIGDAADILEMIMGALEQMASVLKGPTENRPTNVSSGASYFDTTLNKPIWKSTGDGWIDANGTAV